MNDLGTFHRDPLPGTPPLKEWPCTIDKASDFLKTWYDSGKPFFTKKELEKLSTQLNRRYNTRGRNSSQKQLISIKGLTGSKLRYEVLTGQVLTGEKENQDWEIQGPKIRYFCYEQLATFVKLEQVKLEEAFFPLQIEHFVLKRASDTKLPIVADYIRNPVPVDEYLQSTLKSWKQFPHWKNLEELLKLVSNHKITKVIGIANGPMEFGTNEHYIGRCGMQNSVIITIKESIEEITGQKIKCYTQDPRYTAVDQWALAQHGCEVLEDPKALLEIDDNCILFSCCPALPLKEITVEFARPAMLIWDRVDCYRDREWTFSHNPDSPRVGNMIQKEYDCHEFWDMPEDGEVPFKSCLTAYIRRKVE